MTKIETKELTNPRSNEPDGEGNGGILALAEAVLNEPDKAHLSLEETAEELLALASEASLSSPINRETIQTPLEIENSEKNTLVDFGAAVQKPINTTASSSTTGKHVCSNCAATSTPFWRKSADGLYYCNACGLYLRTHNAMRPLSLSKNRESRRGKTRPELCGNCGATDTPMWRKTEDGLMVCNACGLYHKLHGQHRRTGTKRTATGAEKKEEGSTARKQVRSNDFTLVRENSQITSKSSATNSAKYSLDNQYHHKFDPNRIVNQQNNSIESSANTNNVLPVVEVQPVDARKLAYLKCPQGRTALLAPKISPEQYQPLSSTPSPFMASSQMPPILTSFINSLATTSPDNLTADQVEHPLQPLLTSIVSQKLREQRNKYQRKSSSPVLHTSSTNTSNIPIPMQIYNHQQQQQQQDNFNQLAEFIQNQQQAIYNQQMIQQTIYNQNDDGYVYNPEYATDSNGYVNYQQHAGNQDFNNQYLMEQQQQQPIGQQAHNNIRYIQNIQNMNLQQLPQIQELTHQQPSPQQQQHQHQHHHQHHYFSEQFPEPPLRQLSPFSGIKFDKNLIDLVNMQFWQDNNGTNGSNQEYQSDHQNDNHPF